MIYRGKNYLNIYLFCFMGDKMMWHSIKIADLIIKKTICLLFPLIYRDRRGRDRMVVVFTTTYVISAYHQWSYEFESHSWRCVLDTTLCDKVCQWLAADQWFSPGNPVSSTNKADRNDITVILFIQSGIKHHNPPFDIWSHEVCLHCNMFLCLFENK
jgi:hypothetical protein